MPTEAGKEGGCEQMKRVLFGIALVAGALALAGNAAAASTPIPKAYPGKNGLIAFVRANQIYTIRPSGTGLKKLTSSGKNYGPVWNPAGTEIAYEHEAPAGVRNIWVMNANGSNKRQWTNTGITWGEPAWSPSGKKLLITNGGQWGTLETTSGTTPRQPRHALYGYNQDDGNHYTVLEGHNPAWTSGNIAFTASPFYAAADTCFPTGGSSFMGETCIDIYNTANKHFSIADSPATGKVLATNCPGEGGASNIAEVNWSRWAPDGSDLLYQYQTWNDDCTESPSNISAVYGNVVSRPGDAPADYSPDGTSIVLTSTLPGQKANIIIESNTGANRRTLTQGYEPTWQPLP